MKLILSTLDPLQWLAAILVIVALVVAGHRAYQRLSTKNLRKWSVVSLNLLAALALLGFILEPMSLQSPAPLTLKTPGSIEPDANLTAQSVLLSSPSSQFLQVKGDGLKAKEWQEFKSIQIAYDIPTLRMGIVQASWPMQLKLGEYLHFTAELSNQVRGRYQVLLLDPADSVVDEVAILNGENIRLMHQPKVAGRHLYQIQVKDKQGELIASEKLPVVVTKTNKPRLLVLQSAPSFETRQLQNWAGDFGVQMLFKTQISRDRFIDKQINMEAPISTGSRFAIDQSLLAAFDLLIIDGRQLLSLKDDESEALLNAVNLGLGVLVLADNNLLQASKAGLPAILRGFSLQANPELDEVTPYWSDNGQGLVAPRAPFTPVVAADLGYQLKETAAPATLVRSAENRALVASYSLGKGRVALSLLKQSYRWMTAGDTAGYSHYWQWLMAQVSRPEANIQLLNSGQKFLSGEAGDLCFAAHSSFAEEKINVSSQGFSDQLTLSARENTLAPNCARFWPLSSGWYKVSGKNRRDGSDPSEISLYVFDRDNDWQTEQQAERINATLAKQSRYDNKSRVQVAYEWQAIDPWIFWWLFLLSASLLWIERRLH